MASNSNRLRPSLLNSAIARRNIADASAAVLEITGALSSIDRMAEIWSSLDNVRYAPDPVLSREGRALRYQQAWSRATAATTTMARVAANNIAERRTKVRHDALGKAGLLHEHPSAAEIRTVLRTLSQKDRDAALSHALRTGDIAVLSSIRDAHELLLGPVTVPVTTMIEAHIAARAPEETALLADLDAAEEALKLAYDAFSRSAEGMRDLPAEDRGNAGAKAARDAEAQLGAALNGLPGEDG